MTVLIAGDGTTGPPVGTRVTRHTSGRTLPVERLGHPTAGQSEPAGVAVARLSQEGGSSTLGVGFEPAGVAVMGRSVAERVGSVAGHTSCCEQQEGVA